MAHNINLNGIERDGIIKLLDFFKKEHEHTNRALIENGEGKRCTKWDDITIPVKNIIEFLGHSTDKR